VSDWISIGGLLGGTGLFLLGMNLMTDGLKLAAGPMWRTRCRSSLRPTTNRSTVTPICASRPTSAEVSSKAVNS